MELPGAPLPLVAHPNHQGRDCRPGSLDLPPVTEIGLDAAYVPCADDIALTRPGTEFAARLGVDPVVIPGNHMTMLTQPAIVADALLAVL